MIAPVCVALSSLPFLGGSQGTASRIHQNQDTQLRQLPHTTGAIGTSERMPTGVRELVIAQAAASGNPFWARKAIEEKRS